MGRERIKLLFAGRIEGYRYPRKRMPARVQPCFQTPLFHLKDTTIYTGEVHAGVVSMWWRARRSGWLWLLMGVMVVLASLFWLGRRPLRLSPDTPAVQWQLALEQASVRDERTLLVILGADEAFRRDVPLPTSCSPGTTLFRPSCGSQTAPKARWSSSWC